MIKDLSHLPRPQTTTAGEPPDPEPRFVHLLVEKMAAANKAAGPKPTAHGTRTRHSDAGKCARAIGYRAAGVPESDPMDLPGVWVTSLGTIIHEAWQEALREQYPDAVIEPKLQIDGFDGSGHADAEIVTYRPLTDAEMADVLAHAPMDVVHSACMSDGDDIEHRIMVELKTMGGFAYKMKVGARGAAEGPSFEHKMQGALNAVAKDCDELVLSYIATEAISKGIADKKGFTELGRFCAEWSYTRDEFEPWAHAEQARLQGILDLLDNGQLPARKIPNPELPKGSEITDPATGRWEQRSKSGDLLDTGTWWACDYCPWKSTCSKTASGRIPVSDVHVQLGGAA